MRSHSELLAEGLSGEDMHLAERSGMGRNWRQKDPLRGSLEAGAEEQGPGQDAGPTQEACFGLLCYFSGIKGLGCPMLSAPRAEVETVVSKGPS